MLANFMDDNGIKVTEMAGDLEVDPAQVSRWRSSAANHTRRSIDLILSYLTKRLGRQVTYEEAFLGQPSQMAS